MRLLETGTPAGVGKPMAHFAGALCLLSCATSVIAETSVTTNIISVFGADAPYTSTFDSMTDGSFEPQKEPTWYTNPDAVISAGRLELNGQATMINLTSESNALWSEINIIPVPFESGVTPALAPEAVVAFFFNSVGDFQVLDGSTWITAAAVPVSQIQTEHRITTIVDYEARTYSLWLNGVRVAEDLDFTRPGNNTPLQIRFDGDGAVSDLRLSTGEPAALDNDGDGLINSWEIAQGIDPEIATGNDGSNGNPDGDSFTNLEEYQYNLTALSYETRVEGSIDTVLTFESEQGWISGDLNNQFGWLATNAAVLEDSSIFTTQGDTGVEVLPEFSYADAAFANIDSSRRNIRLTVDLAPMAFSNFAELPLPDNASRLAFFIREDTSIHATDGVSGTDPVWSNTGIVSQIDIASWNRVELHIDYLTEQYTLRVINPEDTTDTSAPYGPFNLMPGTETTVDHVVQLTISNEASSGETYFDNVRVSATAESIN
ncbi:MAG: hypothetical protein AAF212_03965 [Verrucomicrobiota bacterium]